MTNITVTLPIPTFEYQRLANTAFAMRRPVEEVIVYALKLGSPPGWDDVPVEFQADLADMDRLEDDMLWVIAHSKKEPASLLRYDELLARNQDNLLTTTEKQELRQLRTEADRFMLHKAHAATLLHWRGYRNVTPLAEAAHLLLADYQTDAELTNFTALDNEPFYSDPEIT